MVSRSRSRSRSRSSLLVSQRARRDDSGGGDKTCKVGRQSWFKSMHCAYTSDSGGGGENA
jgi:hypothetical protein